MRFSILCVLPLALFTFGCGKQVPSLAPVSGRVLLDNQPLAKTTVRFMPAKADAVAIEALGTTDEQGNYSLQPLGDWGELQGAPPGEYLVQIARFDRETNRQLVPERYSRMTELTFTVPPGGAKNADFHLTSAPRSRR